jgi:hypothetical protein
MKKLAFLFLVLLLSFSFVISEDYEEGETSLVGLRLVEAGAAINELKLDGFNTQRVEDLFKAATQIFESQSEINNEKNRDFTLVEQYVDEILDLKDQAYITRDEVEYVYSFYDEILLENEGINISDTDEILTEMQFEFDSERYEEAYELAGEAYSALAEIEGQYTALNLAYKATAKTLKNFLVNNWLKLTIIFFVLIFLYFIFKNRILYYRTKYKITRLMHESGVLEELIKKTQFGYFEAGTLSESAYRIRVRKFSELMRDINRQLPLLKEQIARTRKREIVSSAKVTGKSTNLDPEELFGEKKKKQGFFKRMLSGDKKVKKHKNKIVKNVKPAKKKKKKVFLGGMFSSSKKKSRRSGGKPKKIKKSTVKKVVKKNVVKTKKK